LLGPHEQARLPKTFGHQAATKATQKDGANRRRYAIAGIVMPAIRHDACISRPLCREL
jgi:hypothetical protein